MKKYVIPVLFVFLLITSCEKYLDNIKTPDFEQKLVINSFVSPNDTLSFVSVRSNRKLYGLINPDEPVGNVTAVVSDGTTEIKLTRIAEGFIFRPDDMLLEEGKTYTLSVTSDLIKQAKASVTIPHRRPINIEIDTSSQYSDFGNEPAMGWIDSFADIYITDYEGEPNYYACTCKRVIYNSEYSYNPISYQLFPLESIVFSDKGKDGERILVSSLSYMNTSGDDSSMLVVYILSTDKDYYTYHHSLDDYSGGEIPFIEISPAYSNIEGGLGIFASYVVDSLVFRLK